MVTTLLSHSWKKLSRSVSFSKELTTTIFLSLFGLMVLGYALALGFGLNKIITDGLKQTDSFQFLNGLMLYYFVFEFMMRYFLQNLPVLDVQPYLHLPLKRSRIVHYLLIKSLSHGANLLVFVLFAPFAFTAIANRFGIASSISWLLSLGLISFCLHYLVLLFKKGLDDTIWGLLTLVSIFSLLGASDYYGWFKLSDLSSSLFALTVQGYVLVALIAILFLGIYFFSFRFFLKGMYPEEVSFGKSSAGKNHDLSFLQNLGSLGDWINLEIKLIIRNKRPRTILFLSAFFLLYGLIFYRNDTYSEKMPGLFLFVGVFITGIFMINYGQFLFSWQSGHFDFTLTRPISLRQFIESKYWLLTTVTVICFLLSVPYAYFGWKILLIHAAMTLFNLGINIFVVMNFAMWEPKKIDLKKGATFNYEGVGAAQWLMAIPLILGPYLFYLPFSLMGYPIAGILAVGVVGLMAILFRAYLIDFTVRRLEKRRYTIAAGFRKD
ncbi:MAG: hypothetical protein JNM78_15325 [Cyclobacteriaceae bacterium]|nr:hypothetical protein [Cyclobacteriaceae bacterium]